MDDNLWNANRVWPEAASRASRAAIEQKGAASFTCDSDSPHKRAKSSGWAYVSRAARASFQLSNSQLSTMSRQFWVTTEEISCKVGRKTKQSSDENTLQIEMQWLWGVLPWRRCSSACWGIFAAFSWGGPPLHWWIRGLLRRNGRRSDTGPQLLRSFQQAAPGWLNRRCLDRKQQRRLQFDRNTTFKLKVQVWR